MTELADRADRENRGEIYQRQRAKREAVDDAAERKRPDTPPTCNIDPIAAAEDTDAPRSLSTVGSQFDRK